MYSQSAYILMVLKILEKYSDESHKLSQKEIIELAEREYGVRIERHAVKSNLMNLINMGYNLEHDTKTRTRKNGEEEELYYNWHLVRDFTDTELHHLINLLLFTKYIKHSDCEEIVEKLAGLSSKYFNRRTILSDNKNENKQMLYTIEILGEAMNKKGRKRVAFKLIKHNAGKEAQVVTDPDGSPHIYKVSPYEIVISNGRHYLLCSPAKGDEIFIFRLDLIKDIELIEDNSYRPVTDLPDYRRGLNLNAFMKEHIYMLGGKSEMVKFRADIKKSGAIVGQIFDWFGNDVKFTEVTEDSVTVRVYVNEQAMLYWALQYGTAVEVLTPASLREKIADAVRDMNEKYNEERTKEQK